MPKANNKIDYLKCRQCRKDRQKCLPKVRKWLEQRCERCEKYNYRCSENYTKSQELEIDRRIVSLPNTMFSNKHLDLANMAGTALNIPVGPNVLPRVATACSARTASQCTEELAYLKWLWDRLEPAVQLLENFKELSNEFGHSLESELPKLYKAYNFAKLFKCIYRDAIVVAANLAVDNSENVSVSSMETLGQWILSHHEAFQPKGQSRVSFLSKLVDFYEDKGDFLAAQQNQERLLATLTADTEGGQKPSETTVAMQRLVELYKKSQFKLRAVASRLGLDVGMCLSVAPLLHQIVSQKNGLLVSAVLSNPFELENNPFSPDILGQSVVHYAVKMGGIKGLELVARRARQIEDRDGVGQTALQMAAKEGNMEAVKLLLSESANVNAAPAEYYGRTALQAAAGGGHLEVVKLLLSSSAKVNAAPAGHEGRTALQAAAGGGHLEVVELLLSSSAKVNAPPRFRGRTALQAAAEGGHLEVVELLLSGSAEVNAPAGYGGKTALQAAAGGGHLEIVKLLLSNSAEVNAAPAGFRGITALQAAAEGGHLEIVKLLLSNSAEVNAPAGLYGVTALQAAVEGGHLEIVKLLLSYLVEVDSWDSDGEADSWNIDGEIAICAAEDYPEMKRLLLAHYGRDIDID